MKPDARMLLAVAAGIAMGANVDAAPFEYRVPRLPKSKLSKPPRNKGDKAASQYLTRYQSVPMLSARERRKADRLARRLS